MSTIYNPVREQKLLLGSIRARGGILALHCSVKGQATKTNLGARVIENRALASEMAKPDPIPGTFYAPRFL